MFTFFGLNNNFSPKKTLIIFFETETLPINLLKLPNRKNKIKEYKGS